MKTIILFTMYCIPVACIIMSYFFSVQNRKLQGSGKIPNIISTENKKQFFLFLSVVFALGLFFYQGIQYTS
ncbi:hypothetical protein [Mucilaginibacter auburnensis]|uniref:hypothetical protein n=1 Tax=Mucilaginibacter auburnensis TaxID=1457233 RepID=UPI0012FDC19D|nr:hypothetical protein [Mucilaginibacter auburnensis]